MHLNAPVILNGVCVRWKGHLDLERLDGAGSIEFDEEAAKIEDVILREQVEAYNRRMKEFEEYRKAQQRHIAAFMGQHHAMQQAAAAAAAQQQQVSSTPTAAEATSTSVAASEPSSKSNGQIHSAADLVDIEEVSFAVQPSVLSGAESILTLKIHESIMFGYFCQAFALRTARVESARIVGLDHFWFFFFIPALGDHISDTHCICALAR